MRQYTLAFLGMFTIFTVLSLKIVVLAHASIISGVLAYRD